MNVGNYNETDLFNVCYEISNEINNLYYNNNGVPSETQVKEVVENIISKQRNKKGDNYERNNLHSRKQKYKNK